jgi:hypothetical protein
VQPCRQHFVQILFNIVEPPAPWVVEQVCVIGRATQATGCQRFSVVQPIPLVNAIAVIAVR